MPSEIKPRRDPLCPPRIAIDKDAKSVQFEQLSLSFDCALSEYGKQTARKALVANWEMIENYASLPLEVNLCGEWVDTSGVEHEALWMVYAIHGTGISGATCIGQFPCGTSSRSLIDVSRHSHHIIDASNTKPTMNKTQMIQYPLELLLNRLRAHTIEKNES